MSPVRRSRGAQSSSRSSVKFEESYSQDSGKSSSNSMFRRMPKLLMLVVFVGVLVYLCQYYKMKSESVGDKIEIDLEDWKKLQMLKSFTVPIPYMPMPTRKMTPPVDDEDYDGEFWFE